MIESRCMGGERMSDPSDQTSVLARLVTDGGTARRLFDALAEALEEGRRIQGPNVRKWFYGASLELLIAHPIGHRLPLVGKYFDVGPVWMSGSSTTVKQTTRRLGPSMRLNADLADWDRSQLNLPIGESGHVLSRHYKDQWEAYYNGTSFPMPFQKVDASSVLQLVPDR